MKDLGFGKGPYWVVNFTPNPSAQVPKGQHSLSVSSKHHGHWLAGRALKQGKQNPARESNAC